MAANNQELMFKCLELTKYVIDNGVDFEMTVKIGDGDNAFAYNFKRGGSKSNYLSPSQRKRNEDRKQEYCRKKARLNDVDFLKSESENNSIHSTTSKKNDIKETKTLKFRVASHMRNAGQKVIETALARFHPMLSRNVKYVQNESKFDLKGDFSAEHTFSLEVETGNLLEKILEGIHQNWRSDPFPAELLQSWIE